MKKEVHVITKAEQESIQAILDSGALSLKNGSATLHFDHDGRIRQVEVKYISYRFEKMFGTSVAFAG